MFTGVDEDFRQGGGDVGEGGGGVDVGVFGKVGGGDGEGVDAGGQPLGSTLAESVSGTCAEGV